MMTAATRYVALTLATATLTLFTACDPEVDGLFPDDEISFRCDQVIDPFCGQPLNTNYSGHLDFSFLSTDWNLYEGVQVNQVVLPGNIILDEFWADPEDGQLYGKKFMGTSTLIYSDTDFLGAQFELTMWGKSRTLFVSGVTAPPAGENFWLYLFQWDQGAGNTTPLCAPTDPGGDLRAVAHDGLVINPETGDVSSRPDTVYVACLSGVAGKLTQVSLGYGLRPIDFGLPTFEGFMRAVLADYCGDGQSWTAPGELITYASKLGLGPGVQPNIQHTDAVWNLNGALCIGANLRDAHTYEDIECPSGVKPPMCDDVAAEALYLSQGRIWSALPDFVVLP